MFSFRTISSTNNELAESEKQIHENIADIEEKLNDQIGYVMRDIHEKTRDIAVELKHNLSNSLRKDFVIREEFENELKLKANYVDVEAQIEQKSDRADTSSNTSSLVFLKNQLERTIILLVELCMMQEDGEQTHRRKRSKYLHEQAQSVLSKMSKPIEERANSNEYAHNHSDDDLVKESEPQIFNESTQDLLRIRPFTCSIKVPKTEHQRYRKRKIEIGIMDPKNESPERPKTLKSVSRKDGLSLNLMKEK